MVCGGCGLGSADEFSFCRHCGKQKVTRKACPACGNESAAEFAFCPSCGTALTLTSPQPKTGNPEPNIDVTASQESDQRTSRGPFSDTLSSYKSTRPDNTDGSNKIGTYVFGAFSALALIVSLIKGLVPIYLLEAAVWAAAAWLWQRKKTHSELTRAAVLILAALIAFGEILQITMEFNRPQTASLSSTSDPYAQYRLPSGSTSVAGSTSNSAGEKATEPEYSTDRSQLEGGATVTKEALTDLNRPKPSTANGKIIHIPSAVAESLLLQRIQPVYPPIARAAGISGTVVLRAIISRTGTIEELDVVSGPALLQQSALDAVKGWRYKPYRLNHRTVAVETYVNVIYALGD